MTVPRSSGRSRVLLLGWDGADWRFLRPLLRQGALPHLAQLLDRGVWAEPAASQPLVPPTLWTSALTGRSPEEHGVLSWSEPRPDFLGVQPVSSLSRQTKAIWNIASQAGLSTVVLGQFASFPAEPVRGLCVSNRMGRPQSGVVHPPRLADILQELVVRPDELDASALAPFLSHPSRIDPETDGRVTYLAAKLSEIATQQAQLTWLLQHEDWDLAAALFDGLAKLTRAFGAYSVPENPDAPPADREIYQGVVDGAYRFFDLMLGALVAMIGPDATVVLTSVHGFRPEAIPPWGRRPLERTEHWYRPRGALIAAGPGIRRGGQLRGLHGWGAASTALALLGLPHGADMAPPWVAALSPDVKMATIPSWESVPGDAGMHPPPSRRDPREIHDELRRMVRLGYVDPPDEDHAAAMEAALRERRFNLARALLDNGRQTAAALPLLEELLHEMPDDGRVLAALGQAYFSAGRLAECRRLVDQARADGRGGPLLDLALASLDAESGRPAAALRRLHGIAGPAADTPFVYTLKGRAFVRMGRWADAGREFERALALDADAGAAYQGLALTQLARNQPEEAFESALEAAERLPLHPLAHYYLGLALSRLARWKEAETALGKAVQIAPNLVAAHRRLAQVYRNQGDFARSADCLWEAKEALRRKNETKGEKVVALTGFEPVSEP